MIGSISNLSTHLQMQRLGSAMKNGIEAVGKELSTGRKNNPGERYGINHRQLDALERSIALSELNLQNLYVAANRVSSTSAVLKKFTNITEEFAPRMLSASSRGDKTSADILAGEAALLFQDAVSSLNIRQGGRTLMSGVNVDQPATISANKILDALEILTANAVDASEVSVIVGDYFNSPSSGYVSDAYLGATADVAEVELRPGESIKSHLRADNENFRSVLRELAQIALVKRGTFQFPSDQLFQIFKAASSGLIASTEGLLDLSAGLGQTEERIALAQTSVSSQKALMEITRNSIISADPYEAASQFQAIQSQLQSHYTVVAKLSQLSLTAYLR